MARTPSTMAPLGMAAPDFALVDVRTGRTVTRDGVRGPRGLLVMFLCNHCPFVKHLRHELARLGRDYADGGIGIVAISSNDPVAQPDDAPERLREEAETVGYVFPYLFDETQEAAHAYQAACTPDFFLFDADLELVYRGQFDASRPTNGIAPTGSDLRAALDAVLAGRTPPPDQIPSLGCNIKWRAGMEPEWYGVR